MADPNYIQTRDVEGKSGNGTTEEYFARKRKRSAEVHNLSERRRRNRIKEKMDALQVLIPNCHKSDRASMLDKAIEYMKTLQTQVKNMSTAGLYHSPFMSRDGMEFLQLPQPSPFSSMTQRTGMDMGFGMGVLGTSPSAGLPFFSVPLLQNYSSHLATTSLPHFPRLGAVPLSQLPLPVQLIPLLSSSAFPATDATGFVTLGQVTESLPLIGSRHQADMCSLEMERMVTDCQQEPVINENGDITDPDPAKLLKSFILPL